jgi:hypothetical protein
MQFVMSIVCSSMLGASLIFPQLALCNSHACKKVAVSTTAVITFVESTSTPAVLVPKKIEEKGNAEFTIHLNIRNAGSVTLTRLCIGTALSDYADQRTHPYIKVSEGAANLELTQNAGTGFGCVPTKINAGDLISLDAKLTDSADVLPMSGTLIVKGSGETTEDGNSSQSCTLETSAQTRGVAVLTVANARYARAPLVLCVLVLLSALIAAVFLQDRLSAPMGGPEWSFATSFATNLTFAGSVITLLTTSALVPEYTHLLTKQTYSAFCLLFASVAALAAPLYVCFSSPTATTLESGERAEIQYVGTVGLFLVTAALTVWAALGQLFTIALLFAEFVAKQYIAASNVWVVNSVLLVAGFGVCTYCFRMARFYIALHAPVGVPRAEMTLAIRKSAQLRWRVF